MDKRGHEIRLTAITVRSLSEPGKYIDGRGLMLKVAPGGSRSWVVRVSIDGKRREIGLGSYPKVSLANARRKADAIRAMVAEGHDPIAERKKAGAPTYGELVERVHAQNISAWSAKHAAQFLAGQTSYVLPKLGKRTIDKVTQADVLGVLSPAYERTPGSAFRIRSGMRLVFRFAMAHGWAGRDLAGEAIAAALPKTRPVTHYRAVHHSELGGILRDVAKAAHLSPASRLCLRFTALNAVRSAEARGARWSEMDTTDRLWTIPAHRTKTSIVHRVPLSDAAMEVLTDAKDLDDGSGLLFPSPARRGEMLSQVTPMNCLRQTGHNGRTTVHGFRSAFRDWAAEVAGCSYEVAELALAHAVGSQVARAYFRSDLLAERRKLMQQWGVYLDVR